MRRAGLSVSEWQPLFQANIEIESAYRPNARSSSDAIGLGQLMPAMAAQVSDRTGCVVTIVIHNNSQCGISRNVLAIIESRV
nr:lytic transglycosylase domain-containing protein [uncultured Aliiroseovarius sp.]